MSTLYWKELYPTLPLDYCVTDDAFQRYTTPSKDGYHIFEIAGVDVLLSLTIKADILDECLLCIPQQFSVLLKPYLFKPNTWHIDIPGGFPSIFVQTSCINRLVLLKVKGRGILGTQTRAAYIKNHYRDELGNEIFPKATQLVIDSEYGPKTLYSGYRHSNYDVS